MSLRLRNKETSEDVIHGIFSFCWIKQIYNLKFIGIMLLKSYSTVQGSSFITTFLKIKDHNIFIVLVLFLICFYDSFQPANDDRPAISLKIWQLLYTTYVLTYTSSPVLTCVTTTPVPDMSPLDPVST